MFGSCIAVLVMAVVYEGLKAARQWLKEAAIKRIRDIDENSRSETPVNDVDIILRTPTFLTGFVCSALVLILSTVGVCMLDRHSHAFLVLMTYKCRKLVK